MLEDFLGILIMVNKKGADLSQSAYYLHQWVVETDDDDGMRLTKRRIAMIGILSI